MAKSAGFPRPNSVSSSRLVPTIRSTSAEAPAATAANGWVGRNTPSVTGRKGSGTRPGSGRRLPSSVVAATSSVAGTRASAARSHDASPNSAVSRLAGALRFLDRVDVRPAALHDGAAEQPARGRATQQRGDAEAARRLAEDRDVVRVSAEGRDVLAYPRQGGDLVHQSPIADEPVGLGELSMPEEPERAQPVVDRHDDRVAVAHEIPAAVEEHRAAARREATAVDEEQHRAPGVGASGPASTR